MFRRAAVLTSASAAAALYAGSTSLNSSCHCQVPCGIFDDPRRVAEVKEHVDTIRKAIAQINTLTEARHGDAQALNQSVRWVMTKEDAANDIMRIVSDYWLAQRVKRELFSSEHDYLDALAIHHRLMQSAMKAKQTTDPKAASALLDAVNELAPMYTK